VVGLRVPAKLICITEVEIRVSMVYCSSNPWTIHNALKRTGILTPRRNDKKSAIAFLSRQSRTQVKHNNAAPRVNQHKQALPIAIKSRLPCFHGKQAQGKDQVSAYYSCIAYRKFYAVILVVNKPVCLLGGSAAGTSGTRLINQYNHCAGLPTIVIPSVCLVVLKYS
jgi:hypothetical protein